MRLFAALLMVGAVAVGVGCADLTEDAIAGLEVHPEGWLNPASENFHGLQEIERFVSETALGADRASSCTTCHGDQYDGGTSGVACTSCHASFPHDVAFASGSVVVAHRDYIQMHLEWDISSCQNCHGTNFGGEGVDEKNCLTCHTDAMGPANCSTCHGGSESSAPPNALSDNPDDPAIGQYGLESHDLVTCHPVFHGPHATGVGGEIAA